MNKTNRQNHPPAQTINAISSGYRQAQVLLAANRLGIFSTLGRETMTAESLARAIAADPRATRILCDALVSLSLLEKRQGLYRNSKPALEFLLDDAPLSQNALLRHGATLYERWGKLYDVVKTGRPAGADTIDPRLGETEHDFARAMASTGRLSAIETAGKLDLSRARRLLDVGGGPGIYAIEFARRYPHLEVVVFDHAETLEVARANLDRAGLANRVSLRAGDAFQDDPGTGYDFVFLSNVIHSYSARQNQLLVARIEASLTSGGRLGIKDFLLAPDRTSPRQACLFAVNMLVGTDTGDCYTLGEIKEWMRHAHLIWERSIKLAPPSRLVLGRKG
ncbi:MAG: acetylserotonin O-methyltransferase [Candidatus Omnitrophica bacterium]|nr:acetylserotonin O-methyltransferase [Candidatus Omnitrophota bacterium]